MRNFGGENMKYVVILIAIVLLIFLFVSYMLADYIKPLKKFFCKIGWHCHQKDYITEGFDGVSMHCKCKWYGYKGMVDSQGNLF